MFSLEFLRGDPNKALKEPNSIVLTKTIAQKYFGLQNPLGKTLEIKGKKRFRVTGVVKDLPANTHFKFNFLLSNHGPVGFYTKSNFFDLFSYHTYLVVKPGSDIQQIEAKFPAFMKKYATARRLNTVKFKLQPLTDIHLTSGYDPELSSGRNAQSIYLLLLIGFFILIIVWINYVNLATARAVDRAKEVGIRKVVGAYRKQLIIQFLGEAFWVNLLACLVTIFVTDLLMPHFSQLTGVPIQFEVWQDGKFWLAFGAIFIIGTLLSGLYPAFVLSSFNPVTVLKGKMTRSPRGVMLRKGLTVFQFTASILLVGGTIIVFQQLAYMRNQNLGFDKKKILIVEGPRLIDSTFSAKASTFRNKLEQMHPIKSLCTSTSYPSQGYAGFAEGVKVKGRPGKGFDHSTEWIDDQYIPTYGLKMLAGRNFSNKKKNELEKSVIINEASAKLLGFAPQEIVGQKMEYLNVNRKKEYYNIVGVVSNHHQSSLKRTIDPLVLHFKPEDQIIPFLEIRNYYSIKLKTSNLQENIAAVKSTFSKIFPKNTFQYFFLDVAFDTQYRADQRFGKVFSLFSGLAILVSCLGLFGLVSFSLLQRTKEVGIRKVLGASVNSLMVLLLKDFLKPILIAGVIALPFMYWGVTAWLSNFAYRIQPGWWFFVLPLIFVGFIAFLTVSVQTLKATRKNPANSLRYE